MSTSHTIQTTTRSRLQSSALATFTRRVGNLLVPPACPLCATALASSHSLCAACTVALDRLQLEPQHTCPRCAQPVGRWLAGAEGSGCSWCRQRPFELDLSVAVARHEGVARQAILALKLRGRRCLARPLAGYLADRVRAVSPMTPLPVSIAWVPSHWSRVLTRGYNPAELLATALATELSLPLLPRGGLRRRRRTPPMRELSPGARRKALHGNIQVIPEARAMLAQQPAVLLVDDVMTSGATASACARLLRRAGASWVGAAVVTRRLIHEKASP